MPTDWQRSLNLLAGVVTAMIVVLIMYWARAVIIPLVLAVFLSFVISPIVTRLQRLGLGRLPSVLLSVSLILAVTVGIGFTVTNQIMSLTETLPDHRDAIMTKVHDARRKIAGDGSSRFGHLVKDVTEVISPTEPKEEKTVVVESNSGMPSYLDGYLSSAAELIGQIAFAFVLMVFMLLKKEDVRNRMIHLLGNGRVTTTTRAVDDASARISRYLLMQLLINVGFSIVVTMGLVMLGVDYALLWGLLALVMRYIPYLGSIISIIPPLLYSFATAPEWGGGWGQPLGVLALFITAELVANNVFEPWLYGKSMGVSEVALITAAAFWTILWGPLGLILASPMTVCLLVLGKHVHQFSFLVVLLGDQPVLTPDVAFYQRLAAHDQDEAHEVALAVAEESGPMTALDSVIMPALCIARRDHQAGDLDTSDFLYTARSAREIVAEVVGSQIPESEEHTDERVRVLICPARDEAEHVAAEALGVTLDHGRWEVQVTADEMLASELLAAVKQFRPKVLVLAALPPGGISHCRYLVSRLRTAFPDLKILIGYWSCDESYTKAVDAFKDIAEVYRSPAETRKQLLSMLPVMLAEEQRSKKSITIGT